MRPFCCSMLALLAALPGGALAASEGTIGQIISDQATGTDAPGCAVGVFRAGKPELVTAAGVADIASGKALDGDTLFYAASVSKQFTALAAAKLVEAGKIGMDDDIRKYLPELAAYEAPVTVAMLMHHSAGIRDSLQLLDLAGIADSSKASKEIALQLLLRQKGTNFTPGTQYSYSNGGYLLLAEIVERVAGMPFADYAERHILKPLGMTRSGFMQDGPLARDNIAHGYIPVGDGFVVRDSYPRFSGSGGLMTSINDLGRYEYDIEVGHKVWTPAVRALLLTPGRLTDGTPVADGKGLLYAGGLHVGKRRGVKVIQHGGAAQAFKNYYVRLPDRRLGVALLCNRGDANASSKADAIIEAIEGPVFSDAASVQPQSLGLYHSEELGVYYALKLSGKTLTATILATPAGPELDRFVFKRGADDMFTSKDMALTFDKGRKGFSIGTKRVAAIHFEQANERITTSAQSLHRVQ